MEHKAHFEELSQFIRAHRSNEGNFEKLHEKLTAACEYATTHQLNEGRYAAALNEIREKHAATYKDARAKGISAWPEFENFVSQFEKAVTGAMSNGPS